MWTNWASIFLIGFSVLFLAVLLSFRAPISNLLNALSNLFASARAKEFRFGGLNMALGNTDSTVFPNKQQEYAAAKQTEFSRAYQCPIVTAEEKIIKEQLSSAGFTGDRAIDLLIYQLAHKNFLTQLLIIDKLIFKEQVKLLLFLNSQAKPCHGGELLNFYQEWFEQNKESDYQYTGFLNFLQQNNLIISPCIDCYSIGAMGKEYLSFLVKCGRQLPT